MAKQGPLTKPGSDSGLDSGSDRIGLVFSLIILRKSFFNNDTGGSDFFFRAACVSNKKSCFSCITRVNIHLQLENHRKELFSPELHWEIFCCITSCDYNFKTRLSHVTSPESRWQREHPRPHSLRFFWSRGRRNGILGLRTSGSGDENGRERCKCLIALNLFLCISTLNCIGLLFVMRIRITFSLFVMQFHTVLEFSSYL